MDAKKLKYMNIGLWIVTVAFLTVTLLRFFSGINSAWENVLLGTLSLFLIGMSIYIPIKSRKLM